VQKLYDDVMRVYNEVLPMLVAGASPMALENEVCDRFEALGHATLRVNANTKDGYIHSLAHGVGLDIHEPPVFRHYEEKEGQKLAPGMVVTFEPGLYYPKRDMGMRIEDAVLITESGPPQVVAPYPHELLLSPAGG
jgi:Xaa-Pro aminopeptidase